MIRNWLHKIVLANILIETMYEINDLLVDRKKTEFNSKSHE